MTNVQFYRFSQLGKEIKVEKTICQLVWLPIFYNVSTETWVTHEGKIVHF